MSPQVDQVPTVQNDYAAPFITCNSVAMRLKCHLAKKQSKAERGGMNMARGPAYPFVDLERAVEFARKMYQYTKRSPADANAIVQEAWNYSPTSSSSGKLVAALKYFGLIDGGEGNAVRLTDRAFRILVDDPNSLERRQALQEAALSPKAYLLCWTRWGADMPPSMRSNLIFGDGFIESTVDGFIEDYKKSVEYAGLLDSQTAAAFEEPRISGSVAANVRSELTPQTSVLAAAQVAIPTPSDCRSDVFSLTEGIVSLTWPKALSEESFQDLSDWLDLIKRKIERSIVRDSSE